jgi:hypothetical protein
MKMKLYFQKIGTVLFLFFSFVLPAQNQEKNLIDTLTNKKRETIIKWVASEFLEHYVFSDVGETMSAFIENKFNIGGYDSIITLSDFTALLESDMKSISKDKHIKIRYGEAPTDFEDENALREENFGFRDVEILPGNIGFISFFQFYHPKYAARTAKAAINFVANSDALIIDLRANGGGFPEMRTLLCSYFFNDPVCLLEFRNSSGVLSRDSTSKNVDGPKMPDIPIFILVGPSTFSCAEDFTFCMQNLKRATVIGEKTGGGAHDSKILICPFESIFIQIPYREGADPVTKKTWEGTGIQPDIVVPWENAKMVAMIEATKVLLKSNKSDEYWNNLWEWIKKDYEIKLNPIEIDNMHLNEYIGQYEDFNITLDNCELHFQYLERPKTKLVPVGADDFNIFYQDDIFNSMQRIKFVRDETGKIKGFYYHMNNGFIGRIRKKTI